MAKRRRRNVVLESDNDEDEEAPAGRFAALQVVSGENGKKSKIIPERKLQKLSQQSTVDNLFEARRTNSSRKGSRGTLDLEVIRQSAANSEDSSRNRRERASGIPVETSITHQRSNLKRQVDNRLWVDKHSPSTVRDLVVHSRKVTEVKEWLQGQLLNPYGDHWSSRVLLLTGPAGVGKTAVVNVLADLLGIELLEWTTPAPELWQEYTHHAASGSSYMSKLDEFEAFLERGRKLSPLPIVSVSLSSAQVRPFSGDDRITSAKKWTKVLFIDDLPLVNNRDHHQRLVASFYHLALSRNFPAIVVVTDEDGTGDRFGARYYPHKDVSEALERGGAKKITFNPVTVNAVKKLLTKVQLLEKCRISSESLASIAEGCAGDIRQALTWLQFVCLGRNSDPLHHLMWDPGGLGTSHSNPGKLGRSEMLNQSNKSDLSIGGRDCSLSLFHALGKFLHNKRHSDVMVHSGDGQGFVLREEFCRQRLNMEEPEIVLSQAHMETPTVLTFLHENGNSGGTIRFYTVQFHCCTSA